MIFSEHGNTGLNWFPNSGLRMRIRSWTAFFREAAFIFWNESSVKRTCPAPPEECNSPAANIYLGPEERGYLKILGDYTRDFDARAEVVAATVSVPDQVRAYALRAPTMYGAYLHHFSDHATLATDVVLTVDALTGGTATWIDPATGAALADPQPVEAGTRHLAVPPFRVDAALRIR
jgi:hypothetical protein